MGRIQRPAHYKKLFDKLLFIPDVIVEDPEVRVAGASLQRMQVVAANHVDRDGSATSCVRGDELPLRDHGRDQLPVYPVFDSDLLVESDVAHQNVQVGVVVAYACLVGRLVVVLLQDSVCGLRIDRV